MKSTSRVRLRSLWPTVAVAGLALALVACGAAASATAAAPIRLHTPYGVVTIAKRPARIVSLSATATEDLYAVGAGKQVVAVDRYSNYPPQAPRTHLSGFTPNIEAIAKYRPDLVLIDTDANHIVSRLGKLGIPVLVEPAAANLTGVYSEITQIAKATGHAQAAARVNANIRRQVAAIVHSVPRPTTSLKVYNELDQHFYSATSHTFIGQMYKLLGLVNIADKAKGSGTYPQLSAEYIIASNPDLIVLADTVCCGQTRATVAARPGWSDIAAVKNGDVLPVNDSIASEWGPRIVLFLKAVANAVKTVEGHSK
jgi:iron complex transport system substrate-binding protein